MQNADALIVTSKYQAFCMELVQSIACGVPVVAFDCVQGSAEIIKNGMNGYLIPQDNVILFAKKLDEVLMRDWDAVAIAETAGKFYPDETIKRYLQLIRRIFV
jgi:glycosyltransferase involved in cell wall biosynthesis